MKFYWVGFLPLLAGCVDRPRPDPVLEGEHKLRRMFQQTEMRGQMSGSYFLGIGGMSGSLATTQNIQFAWQLPDESYAISTLPLVKMRVQLDPKNTAPTISFDYDYFWALSEDEVQEKLNHGLRYAVVTCRSEDWPVIIQVPPVAQEGRQDLPLTPTPP